jgi:hypothetical protein
MLGEVIELLLQAIDRLARRGHLVLEPWHCPIESRDAFVQLGDHLANARDGAVKEGDMGVQAFDLFTRCGQVFTDAPRLLVERPEVTEHRIFKASQTPSGVGEEVEALESPARKPNGRKQEVDHQAFSSPPRRRSKSRTCCFSIGMLSSDRVNERSTQRRPGQTPTPNG